MGKIIIETGIDLTGFESGYAKAEALSKKFVSSVTKIVSGVGKSFNTSNAAIRRQIELIKQLEKQYDALNKQARDAAGHEGKASNTKKQAEDMGELAKKTKEFSDASNEIAQGADLSKNKLIGYGKDEVENIEGAARAYGNANAELRALIDSERTRAETVGHTSTEVNELLDQLQVQKNTLQSMQWSKAFSPEELAEFNASLRELRDLYDKIRSDQAVKIEHPKHSDEDIMRVVAELAKANAELRETSDLVGPVMDNSIKNAHAELRSIIDAENERAETIGHTSTELAKLLDQLQIQKNTLQSMRWSEAFSPEELAEFKVSLKELTDLYNKIRSNQAAKTPAPVDQIEVEKANEALTTTAEKVETLDEKIVRVAEEIARANAELREMERLNEGKGGGGGEPEEGKPAANSTAAALSKVEDYAKRASAAIKNGLGKVGTFAINRVRKSVSGVTSVFENMSKAIGNTVKRIKNLLITAVIFKAMRSAFNSFNDHVTTALNKNAQFVSGMKAVKQNLANAFRPILDVIVPAIATLVNWLATAIGYLAQFASLLTGRGISVSGGSEKSLSSGAEDAASGMTAVAKATDDATSAAKSNASANKKLLASFDQINQLAQETSGGGGGGSGAGASGLPTGVAVTPDPSWLDSWYNFGFDIGQRITDALNRINWKSVQKKVEEVAHNFAQLLNGITDGVRWATIGNTIAEGLNTIVYGVNEFFRAYNWLNLGADLGEAINAFFDRVDWYGLGAAFAQKWRALIQTLYKVVSTTDWRRIGRSIAAAVNGWFNEIDWSMAGETLSTGIIGLFNSIGTFLKGVNWTKVGRDIADFIAKIDWKGVWDAAKEVVSAAFGGLMDFLSGLVGEDWAEVIMAIAGALAILLPILSNLGTIMDVVSLLSNPMVLKFIAIAAAVALLTAGIIWLVRNWETVVASLKAGWDNILLKIQEFQVTVYNMLPQWAKDVINAMSPTMVSDWFNNSVKPWFTKERWLQLGSDIKDGLSAAWERFLTWWNNLGAVKWVNAYVAPWFTKKKWQDTAKGIQEGISDKWTAFTAWWQNTGFKNWWDKDVSPWFTKDKWQTVSKDIQTGIDSTWTTFTTWWRNTGFKSWWDKDVSPWFTSAKWKDVSRDIKSGIDSSWTTFTTWWSGTGVKNWWDNSVSPWFTSGKWQSVSKDIKAGINSSWSTFTTWWGNTGFKDWWDNNVVAKLTKEQWASVSQYAKTGISSSWATFTDWWNKTGIKGWWDDHVKTWFTKEKWKEVSKGIKSGIEESFNAAVTVVKSLINKIIGFANKMGEGTKNAINTVIKAMNRINVAVPDWVPGIGGQKWGFNISEISYTKIPELATGTVIPPNNKFLALLGDNTNEHEIVSPLSTIEQAVENVLSRRGNADNSPMTVILELDGRELGRVTLPHIERERRRIGVRMSNRPIPAM